MKGNKTPKIKVSLNRDEYDTLVWALRVMGEAEMPWLRDSTKAKVKSTGKKLFSRLQARKKDFPLSEEDARAIAEMIAEAETY
jgi:hypothetical protein